MSREIRIYKQQRILELWEGEKLIKKYQIGLGFAPKGAKRREGDGKSPEGSYYICTKNEKSRFTLFMGLSYPNAEDAERGLKEGLINQQQHDSIVDSINHHVRPDWETELGGKIGIHGKGSSYDWTAGCIALNDDDIVDLWGYMEKGDEVKLYP